FRGRRSRAPPLCSTWEGRSEGSNPSGGAAHEHRRSAQPGRAGAKVRILPGAPLTSTAALLNLGGQERRFESFRGRRSSRWPDLGLLGRVVRQSARSGPVVADGLSDQFDEGALIQVVALVEVDGTSGTRVQARVEKTGRIVQCGALGEGELHLVLVRLDRADDAI